MKNIRFGDKAFDIVNTLVMLAVIIVTLGPFWYTLAGSLNEGLDYARGGVFVWPRKFTLYNYVAVFTDRTIYSAYLVTVAKTVIGTITHVFFTALFAYGISRTRLIGRNIYLSIAIFTMFFHGGLIPFYILLKNLGLLNHFLVYIIPALFSVWHMIVLMTSFREIHESIIESAKIDGAGEYQIFFRLVIPLSMPVLAAIALFAGVQQWNSYMDSMIYTTSPSLQTIQLYLMKVITNASEASGLGDRASNIIPQAQQMVNPETIKMAAMIATAAPIIAIYPFLQRFFLKGVMLGSVKG